MYKWLLKINSLSCWRRLRIRHHLSDTRTWARNVAKQTRFNVKRQRYLRARRPEWRLVTTSKLLQWPSLNINEWGYYAEHFEFVIKRETPELNFFDIFALRKALTWFGRFYFRCYLPECVKIVCFYRLK